MTTINIWTFHRIDHFEILQTDQSGELPVFSECLFSWCYTLSDREFHPKLDQHYESNGNFTSYLTNIKEIPRSPLCDSWSPKDIKLRLPDTGMLGWWAANEHALWYHQDLASLDWQEVFPFYTATSVIAFIVMISWADSENLWVVGRILLIQKKELYSTLFE